MKFNYASCGVEDTREEGVLQQRFGAQAVIVNVTPSRAGALKTIKEHVFYSGHRPMPQIRHREPSARIPVVSLILSAASRAAL